MRNGRHDVLVGLQHRLGGFSFVLVRRRDNQRAPEAVAGETNMIIMEVLMLAGDLSTSVVVGGGCCYAVCLVRYVWTRTNMRYTYMQWGGANLRYSSSVIIGCRKHPPR